jgi:tetratricopeptide (TPR) repeat protein
MLSVALSLTCEVSGQAGGLVAPNDFARQPAAESPGRKVLASGTESSAPAGQLQWQADLSAARQKAKSSGKLIFIDLYTDWCGWCKRLDRDTYSDAAVQEFLDGKFVLVKLDGEDGGQGEAAVKRYGVDGYPCLIVLDPASDAFAIHTGYLRPPEFRRRITELINDLSPTSKLLKSAASVWQSKGPAAAEKVYKEAWSQVKQFKNADAAYVQAVSELAEFYVQTGQFAEAERLLSEAIERGKTTQGFARLDLAALHAQLGVCGLEASQYKEAISSLKAALALVDPAKEPPLAVLIRQNLGSAFERDGQKNEAEQEYKAALELATAKGAPPAVIADLAGDYGTYLRERGRLSDAEKAYERGLKSVGPGSRLAPLRLTAALAIVRARQGRKAEAEQLCAQTKRVFDVVSRFSRRSVDGKLQAAYAARAIGQCCGELGDVEGADLFYKRAMSFDDEVRGMNNPGYLSDHTELADVYLKAGQKSMAEHYYALALKIATNIYGSRHSETARIEKLLAQARTQ